MTNVIESTTLPNGLTLIVERMATVRSAGIAWLLPAGSGADPDDRQGLSAMWSELVFRGAGALDSRAQADALDRLGLSRGADVHTFSMELTATLLGARVMDALPLLIEMVRRPRFEMEAVEAVRDLALQSLESLRDDPHERAMVELKRRHAPEPWNRSGLGTEEGLAGATRDDVVKGWSSRALPKGSVLAIAGAVQSAPEIARALETLTDGWKGGAGAPGARSAPARGYAHLADKTNQVQIALAFDAPPEGSPDCPAARVATAVLSGGMSSRLFTEVREKRSLCYAVSAAYAADKEFGRLVASSGTTPERAQETLDVLWAELHRVREGVMREEFERAKVGLKSRIVMSGESPGARAGALAQDWRKIGRPRSLEELSETIERVTLEQVNAFVGKGGLTQGKATVVTLGPLELKAPQGRH